MLKYSPIFECDESACGFMNGVSILYSDNALNLTPECTIDDIDGYVLVFDFYDSDSQMMFCDIQLFQDMEGRLYELAFAYEDYDESDNPFVESAMLMNDDVLASVPFMGNNLAFWHAVYEAIQKSLDAI